jgi:hypothetical protein
MMQFLMGLNDTYSAICGQVLLMNPLPSVWQAYSFVSQEKKKCLLSSVHTINDFVGSTAKAVRSNNNKPTPLIGTGRSERSYHSYGSQDFRSQHRLPDNFSGGHRFEQDRRPFGSRRGRPHCSHCGKLGHWVQTCYELHGYPARHPKAKHNLGPKHFSNSNKPVVNHVSESYSKEKGKSDVGISKTQLK